MMQAQLFEPPAGLCLLTLHIGTAKVPGTQAGRLRIEVVKGDVELLASLQLADHRDEIHFNTVDLVFLPVLTPFPNHWVRMVLEPGSDFRWVTFGELTLAGSIFFPARADEVMSSLTSANGMGTSRRLGNY